MVTRIGKWTTAFAVGLALVVGLLALVAQAATAQEAPPDAAGTGAQSVDVSSPPPPVPGGPGFYSISPYAFKPTSSSYSYAYIGGNLRNPENSGGYYFAPVDLPHGATVRKLVAHYIDNDAAVIIYVTLQSHSMVTGANVGMADVSSSSSAQSPAIASAEDTSIQDPQVDRQAKTYDVRVWLPYSAVSSNLQLAGVRVDYSFPAYLPAVTR